MSILSLAGVKAHPVVCDFLKLTFPRERRADVLEAIRPLLHSAGAEQVTDDLWYLLPARCDFSELAAVTKKKGTLKLGAVGQVMTFGLSGVGCKAFRDRDLWHALLAELSAFPHKVTAMDAAADFECDAAPHVRVARDKGRSGTLALSRKHVLPEHVYDHLSLDLRGELTGTVELGKRRSVEVRAKVYDKRHERESAGFVDPGPLLRVELSLGDVGLTLRDAALPASVFHHYSGDLVPRPDGVADWIAQGEGFFMEPQKERDFWQAVKRGVEGLSRTLRSLGALADNLGPYGRRMLLGLLAAEVGVPMAVSYGPGGPLVPARAA